MIKLGEIQTLYIVKQTENGVYLNDIPGKTEESILLPKKWVPHDAKLGTEVEVFVYCDSEDRLIATTMRPKLVLGEIARLEVKEVTKIGAFLDWGLEKDLFLPFKEGKVEAGKPYLVRLYIDNTNRLAASTRIERFLSVSHSYQKNDHVTGVVYRVNPDMGAFVAVDEQYYGMIPNREIFRPIQVGDVVEARVSYVRDDGKMNLSLREKAYVQMEEDSRMVYAHIQECGGSIPVTDKSDKMLIMEEFGLSKNAFKRAVGRLLKEHKIEMTEKEIKVL
ncbi:MAG: S1 RNA-binding domain-containing protein [Lachnospiraceae bacterium]